MQYTTKPERVVAIRWTGKNIDQLLAWTVANKVPARYWVEVDPNPEKTKFPQIMCSPTNYMATITAKAGQWIVLRENGAIQPVDDADFVNKYTATSGVAPSDGPYR